MAMALCEEFCHKVALRIDGRLVAMCHRKWTLALEVRLRRHGYRISRTKPFGPFDILTVVDSFR